MFTEFPIKTVDTMQDEWKLGHAGRMATWTSLQDLQLNHCEFGKPSQYEIARKICFPGVEILEGFIADSYVRFFGFLSFI